jgi:hypothetical protein
MESNKLIAEFMGYESYKFRGYTMFVYEENNHRADIDLHYHTSWDWLMPVASKCYDIDLGANRNSIIENLRDTLGEADITDVYTEVVKIIKFYNQNK